MGLWTKLTATFRKDPGDVIFREAIMGDGIDSDEHLWRRLSGDSKRDLSPVKQYRMREMSHYMWESNLVANRLIELPLAYLLAKGVRLKVSDDEAQTTLDRHWRDGLNNWDIKLTKKARELGLFGEQCWPAFRDERSGFVRWGYLDPGLIEDVVTDPDNAEQPIGIVTKRDKKGKYKKFRVIVNVPESAFSERCQAHRAGFTDGDCLYFRINDLCSSTRGRGDLLPQIDWLDAYDHFLFGEIDRADFLRSFIWDVTITGADKNELKEFEARFGTPSPGSARFHNENVQVQAVSPDLGAADTAEQARLIRNQILGGATIPEHWFGGAADVNRSTGQSMSEPTEKILEMRQAFVGYMLREMATYVLRSAWGVLDDDEELSEEHALVIDSLTVEWPELSAKDTTKYAAAFQQVVTAAAIAVERGLITDELALRLLAAMSTELGVKFDPEEELAKARKRAGKESEEDTFIPGLEPETVPGVPDDDAGAA